MPCRRIGGFFMAYVLAVDVGTLHIKCAVADYGPQGLQRTRSVTLGVSGRTAPNTLFVTDTGYALVGDEAEVSGATTPDRRLRDYKDRVGDHVPFCVGDRRVSAEHILAFAARWAVDEVRSREGSEPASVVVSYPSEWGDYKTGLFRNAITAVDLAEASLVSEPVAAALYLAGEHGLAEGSVMAICNLGASFRVALVRKNSDGTLSALRHSNLLPGLGSTDFDDAVFNHVLEIADIQGSLGLEAQHIEELAQLRRHCIEAKERLSTDPEVMIKVPLPDSTIQVRLTRGEFEDLIRDQVAEFVDELLATADRAGVERKDLSAVVLTGGSSRIPLISQLVADRTTRPVLVEDELLALVALSAASAAGPQVTSEATAETKTGSDASVHPVATRSVSRSLVGSRSPLIVDDRRRPRGRVTRKMAVSGFVALLSVLALTGAQGPPAGGSLAALQTAIGQPDASVPGSAAILVETIPAPMKGLEASVPEEEPQPASFPVDPVEMPRFPEPAASDPPQATIPPMFGDQTSSPDGATFSPADSVGDSRVDASDSDGPVPAVPGTESASATTSPSDPVMPSDPVPVESSGPQTPLGTGTDAPAPAPEPAPSDTGPLPDDLQPVPGLVE